MELARLVQDFLRQGPYTHARTHARTHTISNITRGLMFPTRNAPI